MRGKTPKYSCDGPQQMAGHVANSYTAKIMTGITNQQIVNGSQKKITRNNMVVCQK